MTQSPSAFAPPSRAALALTAECIERFGLIEKGERVAVGLSGGKDSWLLWSTLQTLRSQGQLDCELTAVHLDQHQPGYDRETFEAACRQFDCDCEIISEDTWSRVEAALKPGQLPCAVCSRLRRGVLNRWCAETGHHKLALGHHLQDALETLLMNLLYGRRLEPMAPLRRGDRTAVATIRPLLLVPEAKVKAWVEQHGVLVVPCPVCDNQEGAKRAEIGLWIDGLRQRQPFLDDAVRAAIYRSDVPERLGVHRSVAEGDCAAHADAAAWLGTPPGALAVPDEAANNWRSA